MPRWETGGAFFMDRPHQFSLAQLFKDLCWVAVALGVLRFSLIPGDDAYVFPTFGLIVGLLVGIPFQRAGEGASLGCLSFTVFMYFVAWLQSPR
jgi:hypothetical protein